MKINSWYDYSSGEGGGGASRGGDEVSNYKHRGHVRLGFEWYDTIYYVQFSIS